MKTTIASILMCLSLLVCLAQSAATAPAGAQAWQGAPLPDGLYAQITTEAGVVVAELFYKQTPMTVTSYVGLAEGKIGPNKGQPFYEGLKWFRVEANFVIQGGDGAQRGDGTRANGNIGYSFPDEIVPGLRHDGPGTLQMANAGPDTNGSQYCFMLSDQTGLNYNHTVFGKVVRGLDVLPKIKANDTMRVKILRLGKDAQAFQVDQVMFDALVAKARRFDGPRAIGPDAFLDDPDGVVGTAGRGSAFLQYKLANFQRFTGERIMARVYARTPADAADDKEESFVKALQVKLKVHEHGALVLYFQDQNKWLIRVAPGSQKLFMAGPMKADRTRDPAAARATMDDAMTAFLAMATPPTTNPRGPATTPAPASAPARRGRATPGSPGVANRLGTVLDNLIFRLEPDTP